MHTKSKPPGVLILKCRFWGLDFFPGLWKWIHSPVAIAPNHYSHSGMDLGSGLGWQQTVDSQEYGWTEETEALAQCWRRHNKHQPKGHGGSWRRNSPEMREGGKQRQSRTGEGLSLAGVAKAEQSSHTRCSWGCSLWVQTKSRVCEYGLGFLFKEAPQEVFMQIKL